MADGKPWNYEKVLLTPFYDILATLKLQNKLRAVSDKVEEYIKESYNKK